MFKMNGRTHAILSIITLYLCVCTLAVHFIVDNLIHVAGTRIGWQDVMETHSSDATHSDTHPDDHNFLPAHYTEAVSFVQLFHRYNADVYCKMLSISPPLPPPKY